MFDTDAINTLVKGLGERADEDLVMSEIQPGSRIAG